LADHWNRWDDIQIGAGTSILSKIPLLVWDQPDKLGVMGALNLKAIDLFAGCGGLSQGLMEAGFDIIAAVEIGESQADTYSENHPNTLVIRRDIREVDCSLLLGDIPDKRMLIDLLAGCPPCQGFSSLRTLNGKYSNDDPRNDLLFEFSRLAGEIHPKAILLENVPALASDSRFMIFLDKMAQLGYFGQHEIIDVVDYAVPQFRKRLLYLAGLGFKIPIPLKKDLRKSVMDTIGHLPIPGASNDILHDWPERHVPKVWEIIKSIPKDGGSRDSIPIALRLKCHSNTDGFKDVYGRMAWKSPAPTITGGCVNPSKGRFIHPERNGSITLREAALLQGFPAQYKFKSPSKGQIALMIGNAFPPPAAKSIGESIIEKLKEVSHGVS